MTVQIYTKTGKSFLKKLHLSLIILLFFCGKVAAQFEVTLYDFEEYGFSVPFYAAAQKFPGESGTTSSSINFVYEYKNSETLLWANLAVYPVVGCSGLQGFYRQLQLRTKNYGGSSDKFKITLYSGNTYAHGWDGFYIGAKLNEDEAGNGVELELTGYTNGNTLFIVDLVYRNLPQNGGKSRIFSTPDFRPHFIRHKLDALGLEITTQADFGIKYDPENQIYTMVRCNKTDAAYPFARIGKVSWDFLYEYDDLLDDIEEDEGVTNFETRELPPNSPLLNLDPKALRLSYDKYINWNDKSFKTNVIMYSFAVAGQSYQSILMIPYTDFENQISNSIKYLEPAIVKKKEIELQEWLGSIKTID